MGPCKSMVKTMDKSRVKGQLARCHISKFLFQVQQKHLKVMNYLKWCLDWEWRWMVVRIG